MAVFGGILIVPAAEKGRGGGHLCRCIKLAVELRALEREAFLFIEGSPRQQTRDLTSLFSSFAFNPKWLFRGEEEIRNEQLKKSFDFIILDRFQTPLDELLRWKKIAPVVGIDEGGRCREKFDFLIDILIPKKLGKPPANISSAGLLFFPKNTRLRKEEAAAVQGITRNSLIRILVSFGQEDSAGLGEKIAGGLSSGKNSGAFDITLIKGALAAADDKEALKNIHILENIPHLAQRLYEYDLVITHYGITAYEALYAGVPVLLAHPTPYHRKLAKAAGFRSIKISSNYSSGIFLAELKKYCASLAEKLKLHNSLSLAQLCSSFSPRTNRYCPVCGEESGRCVSRFCGRTYRRCPKCGVIYMDRINPAPEGYEKEYFFESYKRQYGKTYLEDFDNIKKAGKRRLKIISKISGKNARLCSRSKELSLLDIGCAYGPFLAAAKEEGFFPAGIDPAQDAVKYVQEKLGISAFQGFFPIDGHPPLFARSFDVITLWFVIEHFKDCASALAEIKNLLKPGEASSLLAFSTPSFAGISALSSLRRFLSASPEDHWTVWSPKTCKKALALAGFKVKKTASIGHHPERFPILGKIAKSKKSPVYWMLLAISRIFKLGDTFEVYAVISK